MGEKKELKAENNKVVKKSNPFLLLFMSYIAVCIGGLTLFVSMLLQKFGVYFEFLPILEKIANSIAWIVASILSFGYIKNKKKIWMWVVWAVAVVMIFVGIFA